MVHLINAYIFKLILPLFLLIGLPACSPITGSPILTKFLPFSTKTQEITDQKLSYASNDRILIFDRPRRIYITNPEGINPVELTLDKDIYSLALSPDARRLAYSMEHFLFIMDIDTGAVRKVLQEPIGFSSHMGWSPDGQKLAFDCNLETSVISELCLVDVSSGKLEMLTDTAELVSEVPIGANFGSWSNDGASIVFTFLYFPPTRFGTADGLGFLCILDVATRQVRKIFIDSEMVIRGGGPVVFSPDGRFLFFSGELEGISRIFRIDVDGGNLHQVSPSSVDYNLFGAVFSPDYDAFYSNAPDQTLPNGEDVPTLFSLDGEVILQLRNITGVVVAWIRP